MKKITLFIFGLFFWMQANAQITYTNASFQQAGDVLKISNAVDSLLTITPASATATAWDFSTLVALNTTLDTIQAASTGANFSIFPTSDIIQPLLNGLGGTAYVDVTSSSMTRIGGGIEFFGISFISPYSDPHVIQTAPISYPSLVSDDYRINFSAHIDSVPFLRALLDTIAAQAGGLIGTGISASDSIRFSLDGKEIREVDAFGTCTMSDSIYDVLRQKVLNIITTKLEIRTQPVSFIPATWIDLGPILGNTLPIPLPNNDSTIYYDYLVEGLKQPLVRLNLDSTNTFVANIQYLQGDTNNVSIQYLTDEIKANVFPNPTSDIITLQTNDLPADGYDLHIVDMTGRIVLQRTAIREEYYSLSVNNLPNGHYILVMRNQNGGAIKRQAIEVLR